MKKFIPQAEDLENRIALSYSYSIQPPLWEVPQQVSPSELPPLVNPDMTPEAAKVFKEIWDEAERIMKQQKADIHDALSPMPMRSPSSLPVYSEPFYEDPVRSPYYFP